MEGSTLLRIQFASKWSRHSKLSDPDLCRYFFFRNAWTISSISQGPKIAKKILSKNEKMKDSYFLISRLNCKQWVTHCGNYFEMDLVINVKNRVKKSTTTYVVNSCRLGASLIQRKKSSLFNKRHQNNWTSINKIKKKKKMESWCSPFTLYKN